MASERTLARVDAAIWILIYGGLFAVVLGIATGRASVVAAWSLALPGAVAAIAGVVLIHVRSRLRVPPPTGAQSSGDSPRGDS